MYGCMDSVLWVKAGISERRYQLFLYRICREAKVTVKTSQILTTRRAVFSNEAITSN